MTVCESGLDASKNVVALLLLGRTQEAISVIEAAPGWAVNTAVNYRGDTLLHYACARGDRRFVEYLVRKKGASPKVKNQLGKVPAELAAAQDIKAICA